MTPNPRIDKAAQVPIGHPLVPKTAPLPGPSSDGSENLKTTSNDARVPKRRCRNSSRNDPPAWLSKWVEEQSEMMSALTSEIKKAQ